MTGVQRYAHELVGALDTLIADRQFARFRIEIVAPRNLLSTPSWSSIAWRTGGALRGHAWEQFELPRLTRGRLLLNLCNTGPLALRRQIVTIHDAAVFARPQVYSLAFRTWYQTLLRRLTRCSLGVITPSRFSRASLSHYCRVAEGRFEIVPHGREHVLATAPDRSILERHGLGERPFILAVSSMAANKNFDLMAAALHRLDRDVDMVVAGGRNSRVFARTPELPAQFHCLGYVSDGELRALYERALCLIYPSSYEGFGFPPLEAMTCGCPVITTRVASLPEVCGEAALYCGTGDAQGLAAHLQSLVDDAGMRQRLRERGLQQAKAFSWRSSALHTMQYVERMLHA